MRKLKKGRRLSRKKNQRRALLKSLASAFFLREKIKTTEAKAKEAASLIEKYITKAKKGDLSSHRLLVSRLSAKIAKKLLNEIAPRYRDRRGGYVRIIKLGPRKSDGARMVIMELVK